MSAALAALTAAPAAASWIILPDPMRPKDFTIVKKDGEYHCFYIVHDATKPFEQTEKWLGHSKSSDLFVWTQLPDVLPIRPESWDRSHVWAPHVVERDGLYYLFYTGVEDDGPGGAVRLYQRMGLAVSSDLMTWNRVDDPVLSPPDVPWAVNDSTVTWAAFRDPFVMRDPQQAGRWLMYYTAVPSIATNGMIVGVAASDGDFTQWADLMPLWNTHVVNGSTTATESPHLFFRNGLWYLLYSSTTAQPLQIAVSASPTGPLGSWANWGSVGAMLNQNTGSWFASEYFRDGLVDYFAYVNGTWIEIKRMSWFLNGRWALAEPDPFHVVSMFIERDPFMLDDDPVWITVRTRWGLGRSVQYDVIGHTDTGEDLVFTPQTFGLPTTIPVDGDSLLVGANLGPPLDLGDGRMVTHIRLRTKDQACSSNSFELLGDPVQFEYVPPPPPPGQPPVPTEDPTPIEYQPQLPRPGLRRTESVLGRGAVTFVAELDEPAQASLDVFDVQGRKIVRLANRVLPAGPTLLAWDGRRSDGASLPRGVYFARLATPGATRTLRIALQ